MLELIRSVVTNPETPWVLFEHGTVVFLPGGSPNPAEEARRLLEEWGPVHAGGPAGDFSVISLNEGAGWAVTCHHNDILTFVGPDQEGPEVAIGLFGRGQRDLDAQHLKVIHVERPGPGFPALLELELPWNEFNEGSYRAEQVVVLALRDPNFVEQAKRHVLTDPNRETSLHLAQALWCLGDHQDWLQAQFSFAKLFELTAASQIDIGVVWSGLHRQHPDLCPNPEPSDLLTSLWPQTLPGNLPDEAARALLDHDTSTLTRWLLGKSEVVFLEDKVAYRESELPLTLVEPFHRLYRRALPSEPGVFCRSTPRGLEIRTRGLMLSLSRGVLEDSGAEMVVTGIDHDGRMKGATAQAILMEAGAAIQPAARERLAKTDRSLGEVVVTDAFSLASRGPRWVAHVVSTPKYTPKSPGWLSQAMANILERARSYQVSEVAITALGTSGGIEAPVAARLLLEGVRAWDGPPLHVIFCLPSPPVFEAFLAEARRQKLFHVEL